MHSGVQRITQQPMQPNDGGILHMFRTCVQMPPTLCVDPKRATNVEGGCARASGHDLGNLGIDLVGLAGLQSGLPLDELCRTLNQ